MDIGVKAIAEMKPELSTAAKIIKVSSIFAAATFSIKSSLTPNDIADLAEQAHQAEVERYGDNLPFDESKKPASKGCNIL